MVTLSVGGSLGCDPPATQSAPRTQPPPATSAPSTPTDRGSDAPTTHASDPEDARADAPAIVGITHEELLRRADAEGQDAAEEPVRTEGSLAPEDTSFADETPADVLRTRYEMGFPDERADRPTVERVLQVDDQGDRLVALLYGTGFVIAPGYRVASRSTMASWALIAADQRSHRAVDADALRQWFFGQSLARSVALSFRREGNNITASRGALSLTLQSEAEAPARPLSCRLFVSMLLGGESGTIRAGCEGARLPSRVVLRGRSFPVLSFSKRDSSAIQVPRATMAAPPRESVGHELAMPARAQEGGFFTANELLTLAPRAPANAVNAPAPTPRRASPSSQVEVSNRSAHEALIFVDDTAIGWLAPGHTSVFSGFQSGRHTLRARSFDGQYRVDPSTLSLPTRWEFGAPAARP